QLLDGIHTVSTPFIETGKDEGDNNGSLLTQLSFTYEYDEQNKVITIYGDDYVSEDAMQLITVSKVGNKYNFLYASLTAKQKPASLTPQLSADLEFQFRTTVK